MEYVDDKKQNCMKPFRVIKRILRGRNAFVLLNGRERTTIKVSL